MRISYLIPGLVDYTIHNEGFIGISAGVWSFWWNGCWHSLPGINDQSTLVQVKQAVAEQAVKELTYKKERIQRELDEINAVLKNVDPDGDWIEGYRK